MRHWLTSLCLMLLAARAAAVEPLWIDVRSPEEYATGHLDGAINIPFNEIATRIREVTADRRQPIRLYCGVGVRAQMAKFSLEAQGFEQVTNEGGYDALRAQAATADTSCGANC
jgi:phage shock protein E